MVYRNRLLALAGGGLALLLSALSANAQMGPRAGYQSRFYDPATEVTIQGVIQATLTGSCPCWRNGVSATLETDKGNYELRLGPIFSYRRTESASQKGTR
jgi:hypothetical protein